MHVSVRTIQFYNKKSEKRKLQAVGQSDDEAVKHEQYNKIES